MFAPKPAPPEAIGQALQVLLVEGEVVFLGDGLGFSMTAGAAAETSSRLAALLEPPAEQPKP